MATKTVDRMTVNNEVYEIMDSTARTAITQEVSDRSTAIETAVGNEAVTRATADTALRKSLFAEFGLSDLSYISYNYSTKEITFPAGFIYRNGSSSSKSTQTLDVSSVLASESCILFVNSSGSIYAKAWSAQADAETDRYIGYIFRKYVSINGVTANRIKVVDSNGERLDLPDSHSGAYIGITGTQTVVYNETTKILTIPQGFYVFHGNGEAAPSGGWEIDCSQIATAAILFMSRDGSIYAVKWDNGVPQAYDDEPIGYIYGTVVCLNGVPPYLIKNVTSNGRQPNGNWFSPPFFGLSGTAGIVTYNYNTKILTLPGGFVSYRGKGITRNATTLDLTDYLSSEACFLFVKKDGTIYACNWVGCQADSQEDQMIGYVFQKNVIIIGVPPSHISIIDENTADSVYVFGDSIVAGVGSATLFHMLWHDWRPELTLYNWGIGSTGFVCEAIGTVMVGGGTVGRGASGTESGDNTVLDVMSGIDSAMPNIVIAAGTNDFGTNVAIDTFRTAVQDTLDYAMSKTMNILVLTPVKRENWETANSQGKYLKDYADVIIEECEARGIAYENGFGVSIDPAVTDSKEAFVPDGLHPNKAGHTRIARHYFNKFLETICK